jgi:hypothetical protein
MLTLFIMFCLYLVNKDIQAYKTAIENDLYEHSGY